MLKNMSIVDEDFRVYNFSLQIIPSPKPRSSKWISSSVPESGWTTPMAQLSSAAYHVSNLLSPVLFDVSFFLIEIVFF